jgi:hypothetical protein
VRRSIQARHFGLDLPGLRHAFPPRTGNIALFKQLPPRGPIVFTNNLNIMAEELLKSVQETKVEYRRLVNSGLRVSVPILGAMSLGNPAWAPWILDEEKSLPLLKAAYDRGLNTVRICLLAMQILIPVVGHCQCLLKRRVRNNCRQGAQKIQYSST